MAMTNETRIPLDPDTAAVVRTLQERMAGFQRATQHAQAALDAALSRLAERHGITSGAARVEGDELVIVQPAQ